MLTALLSRFPKQKSKLRAIYYKGKRRLVDSFYSYGERELGEALQTLGVRPGDALMVHAGFDGFSGFRGAPSNLLDTLISAVGSDGHLLMVSMAYMSSAYDYLRKGKPFDVRRTVSHMGIISETFRRRPGVCRSLHPSNPVLAYGPRADWIVEGHENCLKPCGTGSPFDKIAQMRAKVLFYDASIYTQTFFHYLEDMIEEYLAFPLFREEAMTAVVIDSASHTRTIRTLTYSDEAIRRRRPKVLIDELDNLRLIQRERVGNSRLILLRTEDEIRVVRDMAQRGVFFYDQAQGVIETQCS